MYKEIPRITPIYIPRTPFPRIPSNFFQSDQSLGLDNEENNFGGDKASYNHTGKNSTNFPSAYSHQRTFSFFHILRKMIEMSVAQNG